MIAGRNGPCPCGSGKKYKRCCEDRSPGALPHGAGRQDQEPAWEMRRAQGRVEPQILAFARSFLGREGLEAAVEEFTFGDPKIPIDGAEEQLFLPWLLYTYERTLGVDGEVCLRDPERTVAGAFLSKRGYTIGATERRFIQACLGAGHSFFDVLRVDPGAGLRLRDILLGAEHEVAERSASLTLRPGHVIYGRLAPFDGFTLLVGTGSIVMRSTDKAGVLALRKSLRGRHGEITPALLGQIEEQLREIYLDAREAALNPRMPTMANTDGDPIELHEIRYAIEDPERAFQALRTLAVGASEGELRSRGSTGRDGRLKKIEFPWLRRGNRMNEGWENTGLGRILIDGKKLSVEVNSSKRAQKIRAIIDRRLAGEARFLKAEVQSFEAAMRKHRRRSRDSADRAAREGEDLMAIPEVRARLKQIQAAMYEDWPDHPLPALGGKTPREATADPEGREMVEALLDDFERTEEEGRPEGLRYDFSVLRRRLGLPVRPR